MRLGIVPHRVVVKRDGGYFATAELSLFLEETAGWCEQITVYVPPTGDPRRAVYALSPAVNVIPLPDRLTTRVPGLSGLFGAARDWVGQFHIFLTGFANQDALYLFAPSIYGCLAAVAASLRRRPYGVYLAGDIEGAVGGTRWQRFGVTHRFFVMAFSVGLGVALRQARFVVAPGRVPFQRLLRRGAPVVRAAPRIVLPVEAMHRREDTCQTVPVRLLSVGRITREKGVGDLLEAARQLQDSGMKLRLDIVGGGAAQVEYQEAVARMGLGEIVTFFGSVPQGPQLFRHYREADIFVMPSWAEGFPRVLYEAAAHSLPMVSTDVGGIPDRLRDGEEALLVPPHNPEALAAAIRRLMSDGELRRRLIQRAFAQAEEALRTSPAQQFRELAARCF